MTDRYRIEVRKILRQTQRERERERERETDRQTDKQTYIQRKRLTNVIGMK